MANIGEPMRRHHVIPLDHPIGRHSHLKVMSAFDPKRT
jgi:hypothetical protein